VIVQLRAYVPSFTNFVLQRCGACFLLSSRETVLLVHCKCSMEDRFLHLVDELNLLGFRICALIFVERRMHMHAQLTEAFARIYIRETSVE